MKKYWAILLVVFIISCKSKSVLVDGTADTEMKTAKIIEKHYNNKADFAAVYIKASARYSDANQTQNVTAEIKIKKEEIILISIRFFGITMAKALITPNEVKYYEKINGKYFEGDYTTLSQWLGTDLDFVKVQHLLIGQALDDLTKGKYKTTIEDQLYKLESTSDRNIQKTFYFESENFLVKKQQIIQPDQDRKLEVSYANHSKYKEMILPTELLIEAIQKKGKTNISIDYNTIMFYDELSYPYSVPNGYERLFIN